MLSCNYMKMRRKQNGRFAMSWWSHFYPLMLLVSTILITYIAKITFEEQTLISPYVSSDFSIRAYEEVLTSYNPAPFPIEQVMKIAKVTAYSCGGIKTKAERLMNCPNGITATGTIPTPHRTLACDKYNIGRKFKLEGFEDVFVCEDRGGMINGSGRFDLYVETISEAYQFGVKQLKYEEVK